MANQYVTPHKGGGWQVKAEGSSRATRVTKTQHEAIGIANNLARQQHSEVRIQGRDGKFRQAQSYGNDPCPPRDKR